MAKVKMTSRVLSQEKLSEDIYSLWIAAEEIVEAAKPGQFLSLYCQDSARILPRPISICEIDRERGAIRLVYRTVGKGTQEFSEKKQGDTVEVLGPLGNGFPMEKIKGKRAVFMGGGIGIPPMVQTAKEAQADVTVIAGYRDSRIFLQKELEASSRLLLATEDGSMGTKGNVLDAAREHQLEADVIFACGPTPMLRAIQAYAQEKEILCYLSMEERMACGIGACLACVCKSKEKDAHSHVHNKRICKDGPVFLSTEVEL